MIHIDETPLDDASVAIRVHGNLDRESLPTLKRVCGRYLKSQADVQISIDLGEVLHYCKDAKSYLKEIRSQVTYEDLPEFMKLELFGPKL